MVDQAKVRRESMRWNILLTLNNARPIGAYEDDIDSFRAVNQCVENFLDIHIGYVIAIFTE